MPHPAERCVGPGWCRAHTAEVTAIDVAARIITFSGSDGFGSQEYDRLVFALGSSVVRPDLPGLREFGFDMDTYDQAIRLNRHVASLADGPRTPGAATVVVVGAGLTGIEAACELPGRLAGLLAGRDGCIPRVLLIDHNPLVGSDMGDSARPLIEAALADNGVEALTGVGVTAVDAEQCDAIHWAAAGRRHGRMVRRYAG